MKTSRHHLDSICNVCCCYTSPGEGKPKSDPGGPVSSVPHKSAESPVQPAAAYKKRQDRKEGEQDKQVGSRNKIGKSSPHSETLNT
ncbi:hypothetical protein HNY73_005526 [Argiope bruennichi]|uniref:Uncharacterized protein n=1 Tax=Argiope bruennichi TaxID=94029 RepID=A0A8T0FJ71_ARGBR|nr:hypothetical protein HNY73_005526 [Argiope bruennichi]